MSFRATVQAPFLAASLMFLVSASTLLGQSVDPKLPSYKAVPGVSGQLKSVGSDSMNPLMLLWTEKFKEYYKGVRTEVEGQGSSKAMPALIEGSASFGPMSRDPKANEIADFLAEAGEQTGGLEEIRAFIVACRYKVGGEEVVCQ